MKYGGLKFMEAANVKDLMAFLRLAENLKDVVAGCRVFTLLPGIGPAIARRLMNKLTESDGSFDGWRAARVPTAG